MGITPLGLILIVLLALPLGIAALVYLVVPACKGLTWFFTHIFSFIFREIGDALRLIGGLLTTIVLVPLTLLNILVGRWSGASHYGRAIQSEGKALGASLYRLTIGNPARLLCLTALTEGIEKRIPEAMAAAPGADKPPRRVGQFDGYTIVGSLAGGGSGGKLYIADPTPEKLASLARSGAPDVKQVVIKVFSLRDGSSLPQIVRENLALPAAKRLGLILEHELTDERFFYVMRYVPGESLGLVTQRLHAESGPDGLAPRQLHDAIEFSADLARTLCHYHDGGLWHKDVKPDNIIVAAGQAHLVDFGLITPLRSSMTLTTHGTEYFRDPEMVRMALRGVKVHEVDGAKFDIYAAGAVLYSVIENSFPAHGGLSQISKRCPEALRWIVRRAMTDYDKRYQTAAAMLADLEAVAAAADPFALKPAMLPSFRASDEVAPVAQLHPWEAAAPAVGAVAAMAPAAFAAVGAAARSPIPADLSGAAGDLGKPRLKVTHWWTGKYQVQGGGGGDTPRPAPFVAAAFPRTPRVPGATAAEQLSRARERARSAQARARSRMRGYSNEKFKPLNAGIGLAVLVLFVIVGLLSFVVSGRSSGRGITISQDQGDGTSRVIRIGSHGVHIDTQLDETNIEKEAAAIEAAAAANGLPISIDPNIKIKRNARNNTRTTPTPPLPPDRGQLMVLRDPITFEKQHSPTIDMEMEALQSSGFKLRGNYGSTSDTSDPAETELIAELRSELGLTPFNTPDSREVLQGWLDKYSQLNAVLWIARGDDAQPSAWLVGRKGVSKKVLDIAASSLEPVERRR